LYIILTKRPDRALVYFKYFGNKIKDAGFDSIPSESDNPDDYYKLPDFIWLFVTVENQEQANKRIPILLSIQAAKRGVSIEPMLGPVDLTNIKHGTPRPWHIINCLSGITKSRMEDDNGNYEGTITTDEFGKLDWVICGGESGSKARPMHPEWVRSLQKQCEQAKVPFFFKQWGEWLPFDGSVMIRMHVEDNSYTTRTFLFKGGEKFTKKADTYTFPDNFETYRIGRAKAGNIIDEKQYHQFPI
jgi:hypothetical protein